MQEHQVSVVTKKQDNEGEADKPIVEIELEEVELATCKADPDASDGSVDVEEQVPVGAIDEKKLLRRLDFTLMPWLGLLYLLCFLDRAGIGNARLYGMEEDLHITDTQYLLCLSLFFVTYSLFETPANMCLKRLTPSIWLPTIMLLWGAVMIAQGLVLNFGGLLATRLLLGLFESGFYVGSAFYFSCWYKRNELGIRLAVFNSAVTSAGAFGGLLAAAISNMDGIGGKPAWAWIFIIEGLMTVLVAIASFYFIQDFPGTARFLSKEEREYVVRRLQADDKFSAAGEGLRWCDVWKGITDWKTWLGATVTIGTNGPLYAFSLFLPSIISELGFAATPANLLTVPVYIVASIFACFAGFFADRMGNRGYISIGSSIITGIGYIILLFSRNSALSYFATFVAASGIFPAIPNAVAWVSNNIEGSYKRSVSMAITIGCGTLTGAFTANTYRARDTPWYTLGHAITLIFILIGLVGSTAYHLLLRAENRRRDRGERDEIIGDPITDVSGGNVRNGIYETVEDAKRDKGDNWSGYRYMT